jgi:hypothetical protein
MTAERAGQITSPLSEWPDASHRALWVACFLALVSGAAALCHQLLWMRRMVDVLGASTSTFSKVIGAFFLGLALGSWLASRLGVEGNRRWRQVALAEMAVAVLALPLMFSAQIGDAVCRTPEVGTGQAFSRTPPKLRVDKHADWRQWPMSLKPLDP